MSRVDAMASRHVTCVCVNDDEEGRKKERKEQDDDDVNK